MKMRSKAGMSRTCCQSSCSCWQLSKCSAHGSALKTRNSRSLFPYTRTNLRLDLQGDGISDARPKSIAQRRKIRAKLIFHRADRNARCFALRSAVLGLYLMMAHDCLCRSKLFRLSKFPSLLYNMHMVFGGPTSCSASSIDSTDSGSHSSRLSWSRSDTKTTHRAVVGMAKALPFA